MVTGTRARSYQEMVDALAEEGLPALQDTLSGLKPEDWQRSTLLQPPEPGKPPWTVLQLAAQLRRLHGPDHEPGRRAPVGGGSGELLHLGL
jgi:hypothetical protein